MVLRLGLAVPKFTGNMETLVEAEESPLKLQANTSAFVIRHQLPTVSVGTVLNLGHALLLNSTP